MRQGQFVGLDRYKERITASYGDIETFEKGLRDEDRARKVESLCHCRG